MSLIQKLNPLADSGSGKKSVDEFYPWVCPHCDMAMDKQTANEIDFYAPWEYCPYCGKEITYDSERS